MFNPRISGIVAICAFILSFLVGIISGVGFGWSILRALLFAIVFFVLTSLVYYLLNLFVPELVELGKNHKDQESDGMLSPGSTINISVGNEEDASFNDRFAENNRNFEKNSDEFEENGYTEDSISLENSLGLDQKAEEEYTDKREVIKERNEETDAREMVPAVPGDNSDMVDELPDLETMSGVFSLDPNGENGESGEGDFTSPGIPSVRSSQSKAASDGDFNAKEMASAIQTILKRAEKG